MSLILNPNWIPWIEPPGNANVFDIVKTAEFLQSGNWPKIRIPISQDLGKVGKLVIARLGMSSNDDSVFNWSLTDPNLTWKILINGEEDRNYRNEIEQIGSVSRPDQIYCYREDARGFGFQITMPNTVGSNWRLMVRMIGWWGW